MTNLTFRAPLLLVGVAVLGGCEEYFSVDEACSENVIGGGQLTPLEEEAALRLNCYRRLAGLTRANGQPNVQDAARGTIGYVQQNPSVNLLYSPLGPSNWLIQVPDTPGFTGTNLYERLTADPTVGGAGYVISNIGSTGTREFIGILMADDPAELPTGADAIDALMREPDFRQVALQPSLVDSAFTEGELSRDWFVEGGWYFGDENADQSAVPYGRVYYMAALFEEPHLEHADSPVLLPKEDQTGVPLYSWSTNQNILQPDGLYAPTQISYPITLFVGALNPEQFVDVDQNQYAAFIEAAAIIGPEGNLPTQVVHPGDSAFDAWPSGAELRTVLAIYTRRPFAPSTQYRVMADLTMPSGKYRVDYKFRTAAEDPGVDAQVGLTGDTTVFRSGADRGVQRFLRTNYTPSHAFASGGGGPVTRITP